MRKFLLWILLLPQFLFAQLQVTNQPQKSDNYFPIVRSNSVTTIYYDSTDYRVVDKVSNLLASDIRMISGKQPTIISSDNKLIASGNGDCTIKIWNAENGELINTLVGHQNSVRSVAFSFDNKLIASGSYDKTIKIWNAESGELINTLVGHCGSIYSVTFSK